MEVIEAIPPVSGQASIHNDSETECVASENVPVIKGFCMESKEVMDVLSELVDKISCAENPDGTIPSDSTFQAENLVETGDDLSQTKEVIANSQNKPWGIGVSQTGRIIDPICLQQNMWVCMVLYVLGIFQLKGLVFIAV